MIIFLDSNVLIADPHFTGLAWHALVHAAPAWGLRVVVTEVVFAETVAGCERYINERLQELSKLSKSLGQFGLGQLLDIPLEAMRESIKSYEGILYQKLSTRNVEVIEVPSIPHMTTVERANSRRRPCDDKGDGYRDTLNWLILLYTLEVNPDEQLAFITNDTDFLAGDRSGLHAHLIEDLEAISATHRVHWHNNLKDLVLKLAEEKNISTGDLRAVADRLRDDSIVEYLSTEILPATLGLSLDSYKCGLPIDTRTARLNRVDNASGLKLNMSGSISGGQVIGQFELVADATIELDTARDPSETDLLPGSPGIQDSSSEISKPLVFSGIITLDDHGRPLSAELSTIEARPDDLGRQKWDELRAAAKQLTNAYRSLIVPSNFLESMRLPIVTPDVAEALRFRALPDVAEALRFRALPDVAEALRFKIPPDVAEALRFRALPDVAEALRFKIPPDVAEALRFRALPDVAEALRFKIPPDVAEALRFRALPDVAEALRFKIPPDVAEALRFRALPDVAEALRFKIPPEYLQMLKGARGSDENSDEDHVEPGEENEGEGTVDPNA